MARDNTPKERQLKQLERKQGQRASDDRILIVSEGTKTEPNDFREIRVAYRSHTDPEPFTAIAKWVTRLTTLRG